MSKEQLSMWSYWRDDKDLERALTEYFPQTLASNVQLQVALAQLQNAKLAIDAIMTKLAEAEEDDDG